MGDKKSRSSGNGELPLFASSQVDSDESIPIPSNIICFQEAVKIMNSSAESMSRKQLADAVVERIRK